MIHDVWLSLSIYSFTGREVTSATVAALLTILGYSLYDVVIVFDRIRENVPIMRRSTYREIVNVSVHETLTRSLITMLTTLIPLTVLYFFGGDTLKDFAFALLVGILSGGLSSIAIAAPLAALWKEREPENKRRTSKIERRRAAIATDSDVVNNEALARAEAALDLELRAEAGLDHPEDDEYDEDEYEEYEDEEPAQLEAGEEEPEGRDRGRARAVEPSEPEPEPERRARARAGARGRCGAGSGGRRRERRRRIGGRRRAGGRGSGGEGARQRDPQGATGPEPPATAPSGAEEATQMTTVREGLEQAVLLSIGAAYLTRERAEQAAAELVRKGQATGEEGAAVVERLMARVRGEGSPGAGLVGKLEGGVQGVLREFGVVTRAELEDVQLRLMELEHRIGLLERAPQDSGPRTAPRTAREDGSAG